MLQRTATGQSAASRTIREEEPYAEEAFASYQGRGSGGSGGSRSDRQQGRARQQPRYIEEEEEGSDYDGGSIDENDFDMIPVRRPTGSTSGSSRAASRRPEVRKLRVKVHAGDVRYIMVSANIEFPDLVDRVRDKFAVKGRFKIKVKDEDMPEGDMITVGDQDDLDMVVMSAKSLARKQRQDIGKFEVRSHAPIDISFLLYVIV